MKNNIVTHGGHAHRDEFIACCLLMAQYPIERIFRRIPTEDELDNTRCFVVDVGRQYDPMKNNFDHHQFEAGQDCSVSLVLRHMGIYDIALAASPWLLATEIKDNFGPPGLSKEFDISLDTIVAMTSPIEEQILRQFGGSTEIFQRTHFGSQMKKLGEGWLYYWKRFDESRSKIAKLSPIKIDERLWLDLRESGRLVRSAVINFIDKYEFDFGVPIVGLLDVDGRSENPENPSTVIQVLPKWQPLYDFSQVGKDQLVVFAHRNGFMMSVAPRADDDDISALVMASSVTSNAR